MYMPNYSEYPLSDLYKVLNNINKEKFPERVEIIKKEIDERSVAGEIISDSFKEEFLATRIPWNVGLSVWWCSFWRNAVASIAFMIIWGLFIFVLTNIIDFKTLSQNNIFLIINITLTFIIVIFINIFVMRQALAKNYMNFRINIIKKDHTAKYFNQLLEKAKSGNAASQYELGKIYEKGNLLPKDPMKSIKLISKAAEQGFSKARDWVKNAAESGDVETQYILAKIYHYGLGIEKNSSLAMKWFEKAAKQGHTEAQYILGCSHLNGGLKQDYQKAIRWLIKAAKQGHIDAEKMLQIIKSNLEEYFNTSTS